MAFYDSLDNWQPETLEEALEGFSATDHPLCDVRLGESDGTNLWFGFENATSEEWCHREEMGEFLAIFDAYGSSYTLTVCLPEREDDPQDDRWHPSLSAAERNPSLAY